MTSSISHFMVNFVIDYAIGKRLLVQNPVLKTHLPIYTSKILYQLITQFEK